jgi:hypothetical protein
LTQQLDFRLSDFPSSISTSRILNRSFGILFSVLANRRTDGGISDRSFGISFLRTGAPTKVFQIDHLVFRFSCSVYIFRFSFTYFSFPIPLTYFGSPLPILVFPLRLHISVLLYLFRFSSSSAYWSPFPSPASEELPVLLALQSEIWGSISFCLPRAYTTHSIRPVVLVLGFVVPLLRSRCASPGSSFDRLFQSQLWVL